MKRKKDGGYIECTRNAKQEICISIACEHFNTDGTRKDTVINSCALTKEELTELFSDILE